MGLSAWLDTLVDILVWLAILTLVSVVISYLAPPVVRILTEVRVAMATAIGKILTNWTAFLYSRFRTVWAEYCAEPMDSIVVELQRMRVSIAEAIRREPKELGAFVSRLRLSLETIDSATKRIVDEGRLGVGQAAKQSEQIEVRFGTIFTFLALLLVIAFFNSWLLSIFFNEVLGGHTLMFKPIEIKSSLLLALIFAAMEIGSGVMLDYTERNHSGTAAAKVFAATPWIILITLTLVEVIAYALLSTRADVPRHLGIPPEHGLYGLIKYFLAGIGGAITLALAGIGYGLWAEFQRVSESRRQRKALKRLDEYAVRIRRVQEALTQLGAIAEDASRSTVSASEKVSNAMAASDGSRRTIANMDAELEKLISVVRQRLVPGEDAPIRRTNHQTLAWIMGKVAQLVAWTILLVICYWLFEGFFSSHISQRLGTGRLLPSFLALCLAVGVIVPGFSFYRLYVDVRHIDVKALRAPIGSMFYLAAAAMLLVFVLATLVCVDVTVREQVLGDSVFANVILGVFLPLLLSVASSGLEFCIAVALGMVKLLFSLIGFLACYVVVAVIWALSATLYVVIQIIRFVAVPGDVIRSLLSRTAVTSV